MNAVMERPAELKISSSPIVNNPASERLEQIGQQVTMVAHEGRNALQRIHTRVAMLRLSVQNDAEATEDLTAIERISDSLSRMFDEIRNYAADAPLVRTPSSISESIKTAWNNVESTQPDFNAAINVRCLGQSDFCSFDTEKVEQVFRNLIENSIDASSENAVINIEISEQEIDGHSFQVIRFEDNGPGFSKEACDSAFMPFYTTKRHGSGLGLAICRRFIESHGGQLEIQPDSSRGAVFVITLPVG